MRSIEVNELRKHILAEVYDDLPFYIVSGGIKLGVVVNPSEYNRLKLIEHVEKVGQKYAEKINILLHRLASNSLGDAPEE